MTIRLCERVKSPHVLVYVVSHNGHLSYIRYSQSGVKITAPVEFPVEELDMREYTKLEHYSAEELGAGEFIYDLTGCVCHEGSKWSPTHNAR